MARSIIVRVGGRVARIPLDPCQWCTESAICAACHEKVEKARALLAAAALANALT